MSQYDIPAPPETGSIPFPRGKPLTPSSGADPATPPSSTSEVATDQAKQVGHEALDGGRQVAHVAADEASSVAHEAGTQAKNLLGEARTQLSDQASTQQNNLATWISSIVDELDGMVDNSQAWRLLTAGRSSDLAGATGLVTSPQRRRPGSRTTS